MLKLDRYYRNMLLGAGSLIAVITGLLILFNPFNIMGYPTGKLVNQWITLDGCDIEDRRIEGGVLSWHMNYVTPTSYSYDGYTDCNGKQVHLVKWQETKNATHSIVYVTRISSLYNYDPVRYYDDPVGNYYSMRGTEKINSFFGIGYQPERIIEGEPETMNPPDYVTYVVRASELDDKYRIWTQVLVNER